MNRAPWEMTCLYCFRNVAEFVDLDGDPICEACSESDDDGPTW